MKRVYVLFYGEVQGVFFRQKTFDKANSLSVNGFVRNLNNLVEAVFEGDSEKVDSLIEFCKTISKVNKVEIKEEKFKGVKSFKILR